MLVMVTLFSISWTFGFLLIPEAFDRWVNYPGLELWKFANLLIFLAVIFYLHHRFGKPLRNALRARSEGIKQELAKAREDRDVALAKLSELDARFADLDAEVERIKERAKVEAEAERQRINVAADQEIAKIREQAKREIESAGKVARHDLRRFAATESVRLAEEILKREITAADDARLTTFNLQELGRVRA